MGPVLIFDKSTLHRQEDDVRIGVVGIGVMGQPIAKNLVSCGFSVAVFSRSAAKTEPFRQEAHIAGSMEDIAAWSEVLLFTVPGRDALDQCLRGAGGSPVPLKGKIVVNMATVGPAYSEDLGSYVEECLGRYVEAPLSGSRKPAEMGTLLILAASNDQSSLQELEPVFDAIGRKTLNCGLPPNAMRMKLANNLLLVTLLEGLAELAHFAAGIGLEPKDAFDMILDGPMASDLLRGKVGKLLDRNFAPEAPLKHVAKDLGLICELAEQAGLVVPVASANSRLFSEAQRSGLGDEDVLAVVKFLASMSQ